jgi:flagellar basal-body rod protein FlgB
MLQGLFDATTIPVLEQVINFAQTRHSILAGNVANIDTPGYRMRDLSPEMFQDRLKSAIRQRDEMHAAMPYTSPGQAADNPISTVGTTITDMLHHDESNGSLEDQVTAIAKNELQHNTAMAIMISQFQLLTAAISERA